MQDAIGKTRLVSDPLDPARAAALQVTLELDTPPIVAGSELPPFFHQVYFWEPEPAARLGRDGHPKVGGFIPDMGLPRRMWAGGRLRFEAPLRAGEPAEKRTTILNAERKTGRSGPLAFVTLQHEIFQAGRLCGIEKQDLVYREDPKPDAGKLPPKPAPADCAPETRHFSTTLLFRYSALTFNGHRIHYDADYSRSVEGYDGLVVHGPLLAQLLMLKAAKVAPLRGFSFRGVQALTDLETAVLNQDGSRLWIRNGDGALVTEAEAVW